MVHLTSPFPYWKARNQCIHCDCDIFNSVVIACNFVEIFLRRRSSRRKRHHGKKLTSQCSRHCHKRPSSHSDLAWARIEFACQLLSSAVKQSFFQDASSAGVQGQISWGWNLHQLRNSLINNLLNFNSCKIKSAANQNKNTHQWKQNKNTVLSYEKTF